MLGTEKKKIKQVHQSQATSMKEQTKITYTTVTSLRRSSYLDYAISVFIISQKQM